MRYRELLYAVLAVLLVGALVQGAIVLFRRRPPVSLSLAATGSLTSAGALSLSVRTGLPPTSILGVVVLDAKGIPVDAVIVQIPLKGGSPYTLSAAVTPLPPGTYTMELECDPRKQFPELQEKFVGLPVLKTSFAVQVP